MNGEQFANPSTIQIIGGDNSIKHAAGGGAIRTNGQNVITGGGGNNNCCMPEVGQKAQELLDRVPPCTGKYILMKGLCHTYVLCVTHPYILYIYIYQQHKFDKHSQFYGLSIISISYCNSCEISSTKLDLFSFLEAPFGIIAYEVKTHQYHQSSFVSSI